MRAVRIISLITRVAFMITMVLGLLFWLVRLFFMSVFHAIVPISVNIHMLFGITGVLFFLALGAVAAFTRGIRLLGVGSIVYAFIVPAFGLTQSLILVGNLHWLIQIAHLSVGIGAMYLARGIEKRYQHLKLTGHKAAGVISDNVSSRAIV